MKNDVLPYVLQCDTCQLNKGKIVKTPRALQPLPIPLTLLIDISTDFIVGLPKVGKIIHHGGG